MKENARVNLEMDYTVGSQQAHQQQQQQQASNCELKSKPPFLSASSRTSAHNGSQQHHLPPAQDWGAQVQQFQRYLQWQKYQTMLFEKTHRERQSFCGMFRVLSNLVQCVGTAFLLVGLCFQIYSLNSNKWITWTTDTNEGLSYFEGLWNRCTIQQNSPVLQWVCWKWTLSIAKDGGPSPLATPISVLGSRVLLIAAIVLSTIGAIQVWLACKCCILIDENVKPCLLLATGTLVCMSGILSGIGVTWRAIQVLQESSLTIPGMTKYREKPNITFGPGIWFGWISMTLLLAGGMALALSSRLIHRKHYSLQLPNDNVANSRYTEYL